MASGLKMIKQELGPDALILSTKTVRNGKLGLLGKPMLEITAAIDTDFPEEKTAPRTKRQFSTQAHTPERPQPRQENRSFNHIINDPVEQFLEPHSSTPAPQKRKAKNTFRVENLDGAPGHVSGENQEPVQHSLPKQELFREYPTPQAQRIDPAPAPEPPPEQVSLHENNGLESEVSELKQLVKDLAGQITDLSQKKTEPHTPEPTESNLNEIKFTPRQSTNRGEVHQIQGDHILSLLISKGVNVETARTIAGCIRERLTDLELSDSGHITHAIIETIQNLIEVSPPDFKEEGGQRRIALVGPTGVGKTTTLAKIAASYLQQYSNSIALITIDTYRIAAVEQLKVYGEIMHLPVDVVITAEQLGQALDKHEDKDLILIDTAGRSPRDSFCIDELSSFLSEEHNIEKHLVLSATTRENEILETIHQFSKLDIANTIFTKIDECMSLGVLLNTQLQNSNPISYITNGQRVPEDLLEITPQKIAELIMSQYQGSMHE